jgi:hypothetical protein
MLRVSWPLLSIRADPFDFGSMLYEDTTGQPAYNGLKDTEIRSLYLKHQSPETASFEGAGTVINNC